MKYSLSHLYCVRIQTFLFVQWRQNAVVSTHFKVDLLLHAFRNGSLGNNNTHTSLDRAQYSAVTIKDTSCCGNHGVSLIVVVVIQCIGAEREKDRLLGAEDDEEASSGK